MVQAVDQDQEKRDNDQRPRFPVLPASHWWALRKKFLQRIPSVVDTIYISTALGMSKSSAGTNVLPALKTFGIIDDDCKVNMPVATRWRDDKEYPKICKEFIERAYPPELRDVAPNPLEEKDAARRWFGSHGVGAGMIAKASALYFLLVEADPSKANEAQKREGSNAERKPKAATVPRIRARVDETTESPKKHGNGSVAAVAASATDAEKEAKILRKLTGPQLHLNVQIHISPESTPEQIESIFASMAKHLKNLSE